MADAIQAGDLTIDSILLSSDALNNCLKLDKDSENTISSYNEFSGRGVDFDLPEDESYPHTTGPLVQLNANTQCHIQLEGIPFTVPNNVGFGPGNNIADDAIVKTWTVEDYTISSELFATRRWVQDKKFDKTGGEISGNVTILSGTLGGGENAIVTGKNSIAYGKDTSVVGDQSFAFGDNINIFSSGATAFGKNINIGLKVWYYKAIDFSNNTIYLSNTRPAEGAVKITGPYTNDYDSSFESGFVVGNKLSFINNAKYENAAVIQSIDHNKIVVDTLANAFPSGTVDTIIGGISNDDYSVYSTENPNIENAVDLGAFSFACGSDTSAFNEAAYAEGLKTLAYGKASHAEGRETQAGYISHAEGKGTHADALYSHAQGFETSALGYYAHASGQKTLASGHGSFAHGHFAKATGKSSIAIGGIYEGAEGGQATKIGSIALGPIGVSKHDFAFVWSGLSASNKQLSSKNDGTFNLYPKNGISGIYIDGNPLTSYFPTTAATQNKLDKCSDGCEIVGNAVLAYGLNCYANGNQSIAVGDQTSVFNGKSIAFGLCTVVSSPFSIGFGEKTYASGAGKAIAIGNEVSATAAFSYAYGKYSKASGEGARAIGLSTAATGRYSLAFGNSASATTSSAIAIGINACAQGKCALAIGDSVSATNQYATAIGFQTLAKGSKSLAIGNCTSASDGAIAFGNSAIASSLYAVAGGNSTSVLNVSEYSIAVGSTNKIQGVGTKSGVKKSFVAGTLNTIIHTEDNTSYPENMFVIGKGNTISAISAAENVFVGGHGNTVDLIKNTNSFIYGNSNYSNKGLTIVEGESLSAKNSYSCMFGRNAYSTNDKQFIWSAGGTTQETYVPVAAGGSFNINPMNGISGVYIGTDNFIACVLKAVQGMDDIQKIALKTALSIS